ncbi:MAG: class I SAM-dependent methyltransferase [Bacillota bacterium]|jgi:ubiquinone/menaquinone biosynthesis C-methylase UbiE
MLKKYYENARKPQGLSGSILLSSMNSRHYEMSTWGFNHLSIDPADWILDIGCGGGKNIERMLTMVSRGKVYGLDYSEVSVKKSLRLNRPSVLSGRSEIIQASVSKIPYSDALFDVVTAFETVYFWPDFLSDAREVARVLKPGGTFMICNEAVVYDDAPISDDPFVEMLALKMYTPAQYKKILQQAGFDNVEVFISEDEKPFISVIAHRGKG